MAAARAAGAIAYRVGIVSDDPTAFSDALSDQLVRADLVVTSGGVSKGAYDVVKEVLSALGTVSFGDSTVVFGRVLRVTAWSSAVRDGRPRIEHLQPLARLGGNEWSTIGEVKEIRRIPYRTWSADPSIGEAVRGDG